MTTAVDAPGSRRRRPRWLAALLVGVVAVAAFLVLRVVWDRPGQRSDPTAVRAQLAAMLTDLLEDATPAEHEGHGHAMTATARMFCAVDVFGFDPPEATSTSQVRTVYAVHLCAMSDNGAPWLYATKTSGPLVAAWGDRPTVRIVQSGVGYPERVRQAIPARFYDRALGPLTDERAVADMRARFDASVASFWAARGSATP